MITCLKLFHIASPLFFAFIYTYFILLLNHIIWLSIALLIIFFILFVMYGLSLYSLFHHQPGYEGYHSAQSMQGSEVKLSVDKIGEYKENQRKICELLLMMREDVKFQELKQIRKEYLERYQQPAFCNICQLIKCPRTVHCLQCDKCVLRRQKHSELVGMCIGSKNMKIFIQYLFISLILTLFMTVSLILIATLQNSKVNEFSQIQLTIFAIFEIVLGGAILLFGKQFFISYFNALDNITETQRKIDIITKANNPFKCEKYYQKMFQTRLDILRLDEIADPNNWLEFNQQIEEVGSSPAQ